MATTSKRTATNKKEATRETNAERPRIKASHKVGVEVPKAGAKRTTTKKTTTKTTPKTTTTARKVPIAAPKRTAKRSVPPPEPVAPSSEARALALALAEAGLEKKAVGIEIIDVTGRVDYADFLVLMSGRSDRHVHAIATGIEDELRKKKIRPLSVEGLTAATWVILDYNDAVVHVFQEDARALYDIEGLWSDAHRVPVANPEV